MLCRCECWRAVLPCRPYVLDIPPQ
jgi:hypothetical protein